MEYSLYTLNKNADLQCLTLTEMVNNLNLIGFEVDEIFYEQSVNNQYLDNIRILVKIPSNRDDLLDEIFFLSELATIFLFELYKIWQKRKKNYYFLLKQKYFQYSSYDSVKINSDLPEIIVYTIELKDYTDFSSPYWIQKKLISLGIEVKKDIKDILNLVTVEWGQNFTLFPLNILKNDIKKKKSLFQVIKGRKKEVFCDSNNSSHQINEGNIIFKNNNNQIINVLGLTSNFNGKYQIENKPIFLQSIFYDIQNNFLGLNFLETKISYRFLRKAFLQNFKLSFQRLLTLLEIVSTISIIPCIYSTIQKPIKLKTNKILKLKINLLKEILGINQYNLSIFKIAGLKLVCKTKSDFYFSIPIYRLDLSREIDIVEEYSRFIGYKNFKEILPFKSLVYSKKKGKNHYFLKQFFLNYGFNEIVTTSIEEFKKEKKNSVIINNPLSNELTLLKNELLPKLIEIFENNLRFGLLGFQSKNYFEIGRTFDLINNNLVEKDKIAGIFQIERIKKTKGPNTEWFVAKGLIENFLRNFNYKKITVEKIGFNFFCFHKTKSVLIKYKNITLGIFGELSPQKQSLFNSKFSTYVFEFDLTHFKKWRINSSIPLYKEYSKYPLITKDLSFLIKKEVNFTSLKKIIKISSKHLKSVTFFDVYFDEKRISNVNIGIRLEFQSYNETLTTEKIETEIKLIHKILVTNFQAQFRF